MRYSETLGTDTVYAAVKLDDGSIVRLSETRHSLLSFLSEMLMPVLIALIVAVALVFLLSKILTSRIMKPIDALDFANPLDNEIYEEMDPAAHPDRRATAPAQAAEQRAGRSREQRRRFPPAT